MEALFPKKFWSIIPGRLNLFPFPTASVLMFFPQQIHRISPGAAKTPLEDLWIFCFSLFQVSNS